MRVRGTVQGVGFRPFVYRTAVALELSGWVGNDGGGVLLEVEGAADRIDAFVLALRDEPPPLAVVEAVEVVVVPVSGGSGFAVATTGSGGGTDVHVSADVAPCSACLAELRTPTDRRSGYPFVNCTDCGPRYTIVRDVPYDRAATTMSGFTLCARCQAEYDDPNDRRFHAQPNACPDCGPAVSWEAGEMTASGPAALSAAARCLRSGGIVAIKGVGGYHLACDATDEQIVARLRRRKQRPDKPLAVMVGDLAAAEKLCELGAQARAALVSSRRPVVLAPQLEQTGLAPSVAPGLDEVGVMLPSSPLHELLFSAVDRPLVMTSGNRAREPVLHLDHEARSVLGPLVDGLLAHDRPIHVRVDDSVVRSHRSGRLQVVRRARGWVPQPVRLPTAARAPILAVGAHLKSTVTLARGESAVISQHLGDLDTWPAAQAFEQAVRHLVHLSGVTPAVVAHDLHPDYRSTSWAVASGLPLIAVQHHHAHIAACLVEHCQTGPVLGIAYDGVGLGDDGTLWGGEFLLADLTTSTRLGHLSPVSLPGGDTAVREPWRMALAWLHRSLGEEVAAEHGPRWDDRWPAVLSVVAAGRAPETTSVGRLFDAVAALLGVVTSVSYEGQAAVELEAVARSADPSSVPDYPFGRDGTSLDPAPLLAALLADRACGVEVAQMAAGFHRSLAVASTGLAVDLASHVGVDTVALSGGVFVNGLLSDLLADRLSAAGLRVLQHQALPPNDGSISLGQAAVAAAGCSS
ncbi:carbamoyltransferase HypF [soil metagenome]